MPSRARHLVKAVTATATIGALLLGLAGSFSWTANSFAPSSSRRIKSHHAGSRINNACVGGGFGSRNNTSTAADRNRRRLVELAAGVAASSSLPARASADAPLASHPPNAPPNSAEEKNIVFSSGQPIPPFSTTRSYRTVVLSNGLRVLIVKDSQATRSSAALCVDGAGQFADPIDLPGRAHLMEHVVLSSRERTKRGVLDQRARRLWVKDEENTNAGAAVAEGANGDENYFEDWLEANDGDSNGFTAPGYVCFHFTGPHEILPEALERFARLFTLDAVESTLGRPDVIPREIDRVSGELDRTSDRARALYFLKANVKNAGHPFARFTAGSKATLQVQAAERGVDVVGSLREFFQERYRASKATLVVVGKANVATLDRWISPFANVMAQRSKSTGQCADMAPFPDPMLTDRGGNGLTQSIVLRSKDDAQLDENYPTLCIEWALALAYADPYCALQTEAPNRNLITAPAVGFVLTQLMSRRGPGSLRLFLEKAGWVPQGSSKGVPKFSFPVDVSGFQVLRMEIGLTLEGFANRSAVVAAVFEAIRTVIGRPIPLGLVKQCLAAGWLHGYMLAPRPPDAITLAVDSLRFGMGGGGGVGNSDFDWYLMPSPEDEAGSVRMREVVTETLRTMSDDERRALVSFRASPKAVFQNDDGIVDRSISTLPLLEPWQKEPVTGARFLVEKRANGALALFWSVAWFAARFEGEGLSRPYLNVLLPTKFRPPRKFLQGSSGWGGRRFYLNEASAMDDDRKGTGLTLTSMSRLREIAVTTPSKSWKLWQIPPNKGIGLPLPVRPPEPTVECAFVVQLLSSLPSTFTSSQLALVSLWLLAFDEEILDLAELGAIAAIAYESSFNTSGLRLSFRGVSQTLPSYVRRFCRRLVQHSAKILDGSTKIPEAVYQRAYSEVNRSPKINPLQKPGLIEAVAKASPKDIASAGLFFLRCTSGGYLVSQGDVLPSEAISLLSVLEDDIFKDFGSADGFATEPDLRDILYRPFWKPRDASPCLLPGLSLISDSCGRVPR